jgi:phosphoenolpyruvate carboxykinase (GTP)
MAMKPFCGYHFADYWQHWLNMGAKITQPPKIFQVNWFRRDEDGRFIWPGFGDNLRVLEWIVARCQGQAEAVDTPVGRVPTEQAIDINDLAQRPDMATLLAIDEAGWREELMAIEGFLSEYGQRVPDALTQRLKAIKSAVG